VEELLRPVFDESAITSMEDLKKMLTKFTENSKTAKLWVMCLIRPIFTINTYIRTGREEYWALHLTMVKGMVPLLFSAGHFNFARYAMYYMRNI